jgi:hypothetical protein
MEDDGPKLSGKEMELLSEFGATKPHSPDVIRKHSSNDDALKTFGDLPTEIRLLSKLIIDTYFLSGHYSRLFMISHTTAFAWFRRIKSLHSSAQQVLILNLIQVSSADHETNPFVIISLELLYSQRPHG